MALMARAYNQAQKFGVEMAIPDETVAAGPGERTASSSCGCSTTSACARARWSSPAAPATGASISPNLDEFEMSSVHYWASPLEGKLCAAQEVALVGAGNSAGQAAVYLATQAAKVWLIVRGRDLAASMSRYLVDRINGLANVEVVTEAQVSRLEGSNGMLEAVHWRLASGEEVRRAIRHLFLFIGAEPNSDWLSGCVQLDPKGFVLTGKGCSAERQLLETSRPGVFAIGDVRSGSVKRVAAAGRRRRPGGRHAARLPGEGDAVGPL